MTIPTLNESVRVPPAVPAVEVPHPQPAPSRGSPDRGFGEQLFDGGDTLLDDGIMRSNWALPWSDLMMTMFVLFAALLAVQGVQGHAKKQQDHRPAALGQQPAQGPGDTSVKEEVLSRKPSFEPLMRINVLERSEDAVRETNLQNAEIVLLDDQSVKVSVQGPMFFPLGKADLRPEVTNFLDRLAQIIKQTPYDIHVIGHTDDRPINTSYFPSNWELSLVRASHVARYLIAAGDIEPSRFVVMGRGQYEPAATNADDRKRALNRRVEIIITRKISATEGANRQ
jgi:chemotaxis protein MotB